METQPVIVSYTQATFNTNCSCNTSLMRKCESTSDTILPLLPRHLSQLIKISWLHKSKTPLFQTCLSQFTEYYWHNISHYRQQAVLTDETIEANYNQTICCSGDRASRYILIIKPTRCTNFSNLFWNKTLHVLGSSSVQHQEFLTVHTAMVYVIQVGCVYS